jgi:hypothetical protein
MTSGSVTDLDPPPPPEQRWPFYVAWTMGAFVVGMVLMSRFPASLVPVGAPAAVPAVTAVPIRTFAPAPLRLVDPLPQLVPPRGSPVPPAPARR